MLLFTNHSLRSCYVRVISFLEFSARSIWSFLVTVCSFVWRRPWFYVLLILIVAYTTFYHAMDWSIAAAEWVMVTYGVSFVKANLPFVAEHAIRRVDNWFFEGKGGKAALDHFMQPFYGGDGHGDNGQMIPNFGFHGSPADACSLYGLGVREKPAKIYDSFLFDDAYDLLEIKLHEQAEEVEQFILIESERTISNKRKDLHFDKEWKKVLSGSADNRFSAFKGKITHVIIPAAEMEAQKGSWDREHYSRRKALEVLKKIGTSENDYVLFTDVDEVLRKSALRMLKYCNTSPIDPVRMLLRQQQYSFEFADTIDWWKKVTAYPLTHFQSRPHDYVRMAAAFMPKSALIDSGWHCSWFFPRLQDFAHKLENFAHAEYDNTYFKNPDYLTDKICNGKDLFGRWLDRFTFRDMAADWDSTYKATKSMVDVPWYVKENMHKFRYMLPGNCKRQN